MSPFSSMRERVAAAQHMQRFRRDSDPERDYRLLLQYREVEPAFLRLGYITCDKLAALRFEVEPDALLGGRIAPTFDRYCSFEERMKYETLCFEEYYQKKINGQTGHCELFLDDLFALGIHGLQEKIRGLSFRDDEARLFYRATLLALDGFARMCENAAAAATAAGKTEIAASCRRLMEHGVENFRDGVQAVWLATLAVMAGDRVGLVVPGRLDRVLAPYSDTVTPEEGIALLEHLYYEINAFEPPGTAFAVMVGGRNAEGHDFCNPVSFWCLEALRRTRLVYPTVGICYHETMNDELFRLGNRLIGEGISNVAFFNDEVIRASLLRRNVPPEEACYYINSTCVEITPSGSSNVWVASPYISLCEILNRVIAEAVETRWQGDYAGFKARYQEVLAAEVKRAAAAENRSRQMRFADGGKPLQSVFTRDCLTRGRDIDRGGARYNWVECSFVGLANLVDSLAVIEAEVFRERNLTLAQLHHLLTEDFAGQEAWRQKFLHHHPKYGNNDAAHDAAAGEWVAFFHRCCDRERMAPDDSPFIAGTFCWQMHNELGRRCGATADGRRAHFAFADAAGPAQGREKSGPTAAVLSVSSWPHLGLLGGSAFNMKFTAGLLRDPAGEAALADLIRTFMRRGGFEVQVNVLDRDELLAAREHPDEHRDLVVRIGGYTDYFASLNDGMKQELIQRTQYDTL